MKTTDLLSYDIKKGTSRTAEEEWQPHQPMSDKFFAWHYLTCEMIGTNGQRYFGFFCDFNMTSDYYINEIVKPAMKKMGVENISIPENHGIHMLQSILINCDTEEKFTVMEPAIKPVGDVFDYKNNATKFETDSNSLSIGLKDDKVTLNMDSPNYSVNLEGISVQKPMWAQDGLGIKGLIRQGAPTDFSFYYSLPNIPFHGSIRYKREDGVLENIEVTGRAWIDRQWGDFQTKEWEWSSMRFADGDRINLYNFRGGYQVGTYQNKDGDCEYFDSFKVIQENYAKAEDDTWFSYGWSYELPVKGKNYTVIPYTDKSTIVAIGNSFYEGLGKIIDGEGKEVGVCVNESMDVRVMENAPYQKFQFNK